MSLFRASALLLFDDWGDGGANGNAQEVRRCKTLLRQANRRQTSIARWLEAGRGGSKALDSALRCWPASIVLRARGNATVLRAVTSAGGVAAVSAAVLDAEEAKLGRAHSYRRQIRRCARG